LRQTGVNLRRVKPCKSRVVSVGERPAAGNHLALRAIANGLEFPHCIDEFQITHMLAARIEQLAGSGVEGFQCEGRHGVYAERR